MNTREGIVFGSAAGNIGKHLPGGKSFFNQLSIFLFIFWNTTDSNHKLHLIISGIGFWFIIVINPKLFFFPKQCCIKSFFRVQNMTSSFNLLKCVYSKDDICSLSLPSSVKLCSKNDCYGSHGKLTQSVIVYYF